MYLPVVISVPQLHSHLLIGSVNLRCQAVTSAQANMQGVDDMQDSYCSYSAVTVTAAAWFGLVCLLDSFVQQI